MCAIRAGPAGPCTLGIQGASESIGDHQIGVGKQRPEVRNRRDRMAGRQANTAWVVPDHRKASARRVLAAARSTRLREGV